MPATTDPRFRSVTANGAIIPALGFGTFNMTTRDMLRMIPAALDAGLRHIDTAQIYGNEEEEARLPSPIHHFKSEFPRGLIVATTGFYTRSAVRYTLLR